MDAIDADGRREQLWKMWHEQAAEALNALGCPFYNSRGSCVTGCQTEPSCQTDTPSGGWEEQLVLAASQLLALRED